MPVSRSLSRNAWCGTAASPADRMRVPRRLCDSRVSEIVSTENLDSNVQLILSKANDLEIRLQNMANVMESMEENQKKLENKTTESESSIMASINSYSDPCRYVG